MYNDSNEREAESTTPHTPWGIDGERGGSLATIRSGDLYTPLSFQTTSSFTYPIGQSIFRVPTEGREQSDPLYKPHEANTQRIANNVENNYCCPYRSSDTVHFTRTWSPSAFGNLKYYDPLYFFPRQELKERKKKFYQRLLDKYRKHIKS